MLLSKGIGRRKRLPLEFLHLDQSLACARLCPPSLRSAVVG